MAQVTISVPGPLAPLFEGQREFSESADTLEELFKRLVERYGQALQERVLDSEGRLRPVINVYVNGKNARLTGGLKTKLSQDDNVLILPAVAGG